MVRNPALELKFPMKKNTKRTVYRSCNKKELLAKIHSENNLIAGVDEAGRGSLAGPLICAAVILKKGQKLKGLKDSKKLSPKQREILFKKITENCVSYGIGKVSEKFIDKNGLIKAVQEANNIAVSKLKSKPDIVLIDGNDKQTLTIPYKTIIKGDNFVRGIMAASIIAKVTRDSMMRKYASTYPLYRFDVHKGYGTRLHMSLIRLHKPCTLHRKSYTPVAENL